MIDDVPAVDDPRVMVTIPVRVKGRKAPLMLRLPRFDYITEDTYDDWDTQFAAINTDVPRKQGRQVRLIMLKTFVTAAEYKACEGLTAGQLEAISDIWAAKSAIPLGEYIASANSSPENTEAPSPTTSSSADTTDATSDAA